MLRRLLLVSSSWCITLSLLVAQHGCHALTPPVEIQNYKFFESDSGKSVSFKGIAYYPRPNDGDLDDNNLDLFTDEYRHIWERDIPILKDLGVNAIRIYAVDPSLYHDGFMCALQEAGIYVIVGLAASCKDCAVTFPAPPNCYPAGLKNRGQWVINAFSRYHNVIGFSAGNEAHLWSGGEQDDNLNTPCQKKFLRDMREYVASCSETSSMRKIPIGVVVADRSREEYANYYSCQEDPNDPFGYAEWYGLNAYQSCNGAVTDISQADGFQGLKTTFQNFAIPVVLGEYGCLNPSFPKEGDYDAQRNFIQARALFEPDFQDIFSGGFVFEYSVEETIAEYGFGFEGSPWPFTTYGRDVFGVGYFSPEFCNDDDVPCEYVPMPSYYNLAEAYNNANAVGVVTRDSFVPDSNRIARPTCTDDFPRLSEFTWEADASADRTCANDAWYTCPNLTTEAPTTPPTNSPTSLPTPEPTEFPTQTPTFPVTEKPTVPPGTPTSEPSKSPTGVPTATPSNSPSAVPSTAAPSEQPTEGSPSMQPTVVEKDCEEACQASFPFGCSLLVPGAVKYACRANGGCFYATSIEQDYPLDGFCTFQVDLPGTPAPSPLVTSSAASSRFHFGGLAVMVLVPLAVVVGVL